MGVLVAVLGLACAFAVTTTVALYIHDGMRSDAWLANADRLYRANERWLMNGKEGVFGLMGSTGLEVGPLIEENTPGVQATTRLFPIQAEVTNSLGDSFKTDIMMAEANMADLLAFPVQVGDIAQALSDPSGLVLTAEQAEKLFGGDAMGQTLTVTYKDQSFDHKVGAVLKPLPPNTQFALNVLIPWNDECMDVKDGLGTGAEAYTYMLMEPGADEETLKAHVAEQIAPMRPPHGDMTFKMTVSPVIGSQYYSKAYNDMKPTTSTRMSRIVLIMAAVLLITACFNFVHLFTSLNLGRGREVAIRRIAGATRAHLMGVFLMEAGVMALAAYGLGLLIAADIATSADMLLNGGVKIFAAGRGPLLLVGSTAALLVALLTAAAMIIQISRMKPQALLHHSQRAVTGGRGWLKSVLVGLQALALVGSLIAAAQIYHQFNHYLTLERGLRVNGVMMIPPPFDESQSARFKGDFRKELEALKGVGEVHEIHHPPFSSGLMLFNLKGPGMDAPIQTAVNDVGPHYFETFDITPLAIVDEEFTGLKHVIALPESSLKAFGFESPEAAINQTLTSVYKNREGVPDKTTEYRIMAVIPDVKDSGYRHRQPVVYGLTDLFETWYTRYVVLADTDDPALKEAVRSLWLSHFPDFEKDAEIRWFSDAIADRYRKTESMAKAVFAMASFCLLLCLAGLYGMASHYTATKAREIALRRVLGAGKREVSQLFLRKMLLPVTIGGVISLVPTWWLMMRYLENHAEQAVLPLGVYPLTLVTIILVAALMLMGHVRRVLRLRPASVLYHE
jgi:putative ABC transport system permease protein